MSKYPGIVQIYFKCAKPTFTFTRDVVVLTSNAAKKSYTISFFFLSDEKSSYSFKLLAPLLARSQAELREDVCSSHLLSHTHTHTQINTDFVSLSGSPPTHLELLDVVQKSSTKVRIRSLIPLHWCFHEPQCP